MGYTKSNALQKVLYLLIIILLLLPTTSSEDTTDPVLQFVSPTPDNYAEHTDGNVIINVSITEENLSSLTYNWNGENYTAYNESQVLLHNFDSAGKNDSIKAVYTVTSSGYCYQDLKNVADYTIQSGDYVEYDVLWTSTTDEIAFDYTCSDGSTNLRDGTGPTTDQNGLRAHPATDLSDYAYNTWYHRKIAIPQDQVGKTIAYYDIVCEADISGTHTGYLDNIIITNGADIIRKTIFSQGAITPYHHIRNNQAVPTITNTTDAPARNTDSSIYYNNATINGATYSSAGKYYGAFSFDGTDDFISIPDDSSLRFGTGEFTIAFWYKITSAATSTQQILCKRVQSGGNYEVQLESNGKMRIYLEGGGSSINFESQENVPINQWTYVIFTRNEGYVSLYINGQLQGSQASNNNIDSSATLTLGRDVAQENEYFQGMVDELRIWNVGFDQQGVYQNYASNLRKVDSDTWIYYTNQSKNATSEFDDGTYTYQVFAEDTNGNSAQTEQQVLYVDVPITPPVPELYPLILTSMGLLVILSMFYRKKRER